MQAQILGLLTPLMALLFAATFIVFWKVGRMKRHVLGFGLGYIAFAIGFLLTHFLPGEAIYTFHATQLFYSIGCALFLGSACERVDQPLHLPTIAGIYALSALVLVMAIRMTDDAGPRLILLNIGYGAMYTVALVTLLSGQRRALPDLAIIFLVAFSACDFFIRPSLSVNLVDSGYASRSAFITDRDAPFSQAAWMANPPFLDFSLTPSGWQ